MTQLHITPASRAPHAPPWQVERWFNTSDDLRLEDLRGRVVVLHAFQMLCPGCVIHGIPQAQRIQSVFSPDHVRVVGMHTVFEHHAAMRPVSLEAFLHEYRVTFPVGVDLPGTGSPIPATMQAYQMRGTPSLIAIDRTGRLRLHSFGRPDDLAVGAAIASLVAEPIEAAEAAPAEQAGGPAGDAGCDEGGCSL